MKFIVATFLSVLISATAQAQSWYWGSLSVHQFSSPSTASSFVANDLDSRQRERASIVPQRIIGQPLYATPSDRVTFAVMVQPDSNDDEPCSTEADAELPPTTVTHENGCVTTISGPYAAYNYASRTQAVGDYDTMDPNLRKFAYLLATPMNGVWVILVPQWISFSCP